MTEKCLIFDNQTRKKPLKGSSKTQSKHLNPRFIILRVTKRITNSKPATSKWSISQEKKVSLVWITSNQVEGKETLERTTSTGLAYCLNSTSKKEQS